MECAETTYDTSIVLINHSENVSNSLLGETLCSVVLDSVCCKTVCGTTWYDCYLDTLPRDVRENITCSESPAKFRFGNGDVLSSKFSVLLPSRLAGKDIRIKTDVIESDIPLLLSKDSMKSADTVKDFKKYNVKIFGKDMKLSCSLSGHYFIPLSRVSTENNENIVLFTTQGLRKRDPVEKKIALKLHNQFSHQAV